MAGILDDYLDYLPSDKGCRILDIGCGEGAFLASLKRHGYDNVYGIDIDEGFIKSCRSKGLDCVEIIKDLEEFLKHKIDSYDLIVAREVIYYFPQEKLIPYLKTIRDSLRQKGILIAQVFNGAVATGYFIKNKDYRIQRVFTEHSLNGALADAGFRVVRIFGNKDRIASPQKAIWAVFRGIWILILRAIYIIERGFDPQNPSIFSRAIIAIACKE